MTNRTRATPCPQSQARPTTVTNVDVFDGHSRTSASAVRMADGLIADLGDESISQPGDVVVDGGGGTLLPGLIDCHVHLLPGSLSQAITFGVTTVIDMFNKPELIQPSRSSSRPSAAMADVMASSIGATAPGGHPSLMYAPFPTLTAPEEAEEFVAERVEEGASFLKVIYDSGSEASPFGWPSLDRETATALIHAAHRRGLLAVAHVTMSADAADMVKAGIDMLAHVPIDQMSQDLIHATKEAGVAVIATLATIENVAGSAGADLADDPDLADAIGPGWAEVLRSSAQRWRPPAAPDHATALRNVGRLAAAGVRVLAGTDAPNPGTIHGASLHRELELLVAAGLGPTDALRAATSAAARAFGITDRGTIEPGQRADSVLVANDPLEDIRATRRLRAVWRGGTPCDLGQYVDSDAEVVSLAAYAEQTQRVIDAARDLWPEAGTAWQDHQGEPSRIEPEKHETEKDPRHDTF